MSSRFLPGIEVLARFKRNWLKGRRVGLVSHPAAVDSRGAPTLEVLLKANARLTALFGPEHGFFGAEIAGQPIKSGLHPQLKIPVYSLYGQTRRPAPAMLDRIDTIVFDLQDLGARPYTYVSTLRYVLEAAAQAGKEVIVADRPIPLPHIVDGPMLDEKFAGFVGCIPAPMCYGMTPGEISLWLKRHLSLNLDLKIAKMQNYFRQSRREKDWPPWLPPSPGIRAWETGYCYLATVFGEALPAINIGRNSNLIFQVFSAPDVKSHILCNFLNRRNLPGVHFYPHPYKPHPPEQDNYHILGRGFARRSPFESGHAARVAPTRNASNQADAKIFDGVRLAVHNPDIFRPVTTGIFIISAIQKIGGLDLVWRSPGTREDFFDKLYGTDTVRLSLQSGETAQSIIRAWQKPLARFNSVRKHFLLYKTD